VLLRKTTVLIVVIAICIYTVLPAITQAQNGNQDALAGFHPYRDGKPQVEGITPGMTINKDNVHVAEKLLAPEILRVIQAGDFAPTIQETTDFPTFDKYIQASVQNAGKAQLEANGELTGYIAGLPFPIIDPADPQAGLRAAWNFRYRYLGDTVQTRGVLRSINNSGNVERGVDTLYARRYGMHRLDAKDNVAKWEKEGTWYREHSIVLSPQDLEGAQRLSFHYADDTADQKAWAYDPQSRRTRSIAVNLNETSFGLNFLVEDHSGFNGHVRDHTWEFIGEEVRLVPGLLEGTPPEYAGKNGWYPQGPWELRKVIIVDATPKNSGHPYGKRRFYLDRQMYSILLAFVYDDQGNHWRTLFHSFGRPEFDPDNKDATGVPLHLGNGWVDYKNDSAAVWSADEFLVNKPLKPKQFTVKEMVRRGK
jgi:hypothetical protein